MPSVPRRIPEELLSPRDVASGGIGQAELGDFDGIKAEAHFLQTIRKSGGTEAHVKNMAFYAQTTQFAEDINLKYPALYDSKDDIIYFNTKHPSFDKYDIEFIMAHEISHRMDILQYKSWEDDVFMRAIEMSAQGISSHVDGIMSVFSVGSEYENDESLSDIVSALSKGTINVPTGHPIEYWEQGDVYVATEIFSALSVIDVLGSPSIKMVEKYFVRLLNAYRGLVK